MKTGKLSTRKVAAPQSKRSHLLQRSLKGVVDERLSSYLKNSYAQDRIRGRPVETIGLWIGSGEEVQTGPHRFAKVLNEGREEGKRGEEYPDLQGVAGGPLETRHLFDFQPIEHQHPQTQRALKMAGNGNSW